MGDKVEIVGAGLAGLSASLRLLERGYEVTLYEQDDFVGGMLRAFEDPVTGLRREHSYHMFVNWYYNFWKIADEIGIMGNFTPREAFRLHFKGEPGEFSELVNPGGPQDMFRNLASGVASPADLFLFMYSMVDLLATPVHRDHFLDQYSVNGFLRSRPYMTEGCAQLHQKTWYTVWGIGSFQASAKSYRTFLKYGNRVPVPQLWLLAGDKYTAMLEPWFQKLDGFKKFRWEPLHRLVRLNPTEDGRGIGELVFRKVNRSPSVFPQPGDPGAGIGRGEEPGWDWDGPEFSVDVAENNVILALSPGMMAKLVEGRVYNADPALGRIRYLMAEPMASVELHLRSKHEGIPDDVVVFVDADYEMTFLDYSQLWPDQENTFLYVTVSDVVSLLSIPSEDRDEDGNLRLDLDRPQTAIDYILREFRENYPLDVDDIDLHKTSIEMNTGEELFANMVGSWSKRPETTTELENLFLAGTYVRNFADVSTVEGAVVSGLNAAEAVRKRTGRGEPVEVIEPDHYPTELFMALKVAWAPYAAAAAAMSKADDALGIDAGEFMRRLGLDRFWPTPNLPGNLGNLMWDNLPKWMWTTPTGRSRGPLFANYTAQGRRRDPRQPLR